MSWMTGKKISGDFTVCDTAMLNSFFRDYNAAHNRGGTNTKQCNLRHLFTWLEAEYDHPHPYTDELSRYAPAAGRPSTLSTDFIRDLLAVTGGGHGKTFFDVRDHALIRVLGQRDVITCLAPWTAGAYPGITAASGPPEPGNPETGRTQIRRSGRRCIRRISLSGIAQNW